MNTSFIQCALCSMRSTCVPVAAAYPPMVIQGLMWPYSRLRIVALMKASEACMDGKLLASEPSGRSSVTVHRKVCASPTVSPAASPLATSMRCTVLRDFTPQAFITHVAARGERARP